MTKKPLLFVHIPKTAGMSIIACGAPIRRVRHYPVVNPMSGHIVRPLLNVATKEPSFRDYESFTVVRDPCARFLSAYRYLLKGGSTYSLDRGYQSLLQTYRDMDAVIDDLPRLKKRIVHFVDQVDFVVNKKENILVDHVVRFENLRQELVALDPGFACLDRVHRNSSTGDISLTAQQRQKIAEVYERDYRIFGYRV